MLPRNAVVLASDVMLSRAVELGLDVHAGEPSADEPSADDDWIVALPGGRMQPKVVCSETADLLSQFRTPTTILAALARHAKKTGRDANDIIDQTYPLFSELTVAGALVASGEAEPLHTLVPGQDLGFGRIIDGIQELKDVGVYRVRLPDGGLAALKMARRAGAPSFFAHELAMLDQLGGDPGPRVLGSGEHAGCSYLLLEWMAGTSLGGVGLELREVAWPNRRTRQLALLLALVGAYAALHGTGILHGDVHPGNVLVTRDGRVSLVDFGLAVPIGPEAFLRGGVATYYAPEIAAALRHAGARPLLTPASEQYAVASLCFEAMTGHMTHDWSLMEEEIFRQLEQDDPLTFSELGIAAWPELESVLRRALSRDPRDRFPSMLDFAEALAQLQPEHDESVSHSPSGLDWQTYRAPITRVLVGGDLHRDGKRQPPTASLGFGAAGIAVALQRLSLLQAEPELASAAVVWSMRALRELETSAGLEAPDEPMSEDSAIQAVLHGRAGVYATAAFTHHMVFRSPGAWEDALLGCIERAALDPKRISLDYALGAPGLLSLGATYDRVFDSKNVRDALDRLAKLVWNEAESACFGANPTLRYLGLAHGWAGVLVGLLRWATRSAEAVSRASIESALDHLASLKVLDGRGARWTVSLDGGGYMGGWCHGAAGMVALWVLAHRVLHDERWLSLAIESAFQIADAPAPDGTLCCGRAGQALALLTLYGATGERSWLYRAQYLARTSLGLPLPKPEFEASLMKGKLGMVLAAVEVAEARDPTSSELGFPWFLT